MVKQFEYDLCNYAATFSFFSFRSFRFFPPLNTKVLHKWRMLIYQTTFFFPPCFAGEKGFFNDVIREHNGLFKEKKREKKRSSFFFLKDFKSTCLGILNFFERH